MDMEKQAAFGQRMTDILNQGALNLAMGLGYKLELFDAMEGADRPLTARELAERAGLSPRYVKEWLGIMATGAVVEITQAFEDSLGDEIQYFLPPEHAAFLTRGAGNNNMGVYTQEMPLLTRIAWEEVGKGFKTGEGIPFSAYPKFQDFMGQLSDAKHEQVLVEKFLPCVDGGRMVEKLESGIRVCDLGCGQGVALALMARAFPNSSFVGMDIDPPSVAVARKRRIPNLEFVQVDVADPGQMAPWENQFDYVTAFDAIHDQSHPMEALMGVRSILVSGGCFSMVDIDAASSHGGNLSHPMGPFLYAVSLMHCMPQGLDDNGTGLGMMWGRERAVILLREAGFSHVDVCEMPHDPFNIHYFCRL
ncbi:MAG: methyltransferase domain-containing protein [Desulfovibrionales bacterium]|nr:methyltransferase domain-containing protein [Desulfovibrionales bacterium]